MNGEGVEADGAQEIVDDEGGFDVGNGGEGADRIEIALHEFTITAALGVFAAPDGGDVIALERRAEFGEVLGGEAGQGHG